MIFDFFLLVW